MNSFWKGAFAIVICSIAAGRLHAAVIDGDLDPIPSSYNLTTQGQLDWIHWGLTTASSVNRKATGGSQISNFTKITPSGKSTSNSVRMSAGGDTPSHTIWSDGSPTASANTTTGVYINNFDGDVAPGRGYQFTVPADELERILTVYVGTFNACGTLEATLSDGSAPKYSELLVGALNDTVQGVYTIRYAADSPNQTLTIKWTETADLGNADNVTLQAAALRLAVVPEPTALLTLAAASLLTFRRKKN